jgi:hypothetical protein
MDSHVLARARAACASADVKALRESLRASAATHLLLPGGAILRLEEEALANSSEAAALGKESEEIPQQFFCRSGAASGTFDSDSFIERIAAHPDVRDYAARTWGEEIDLIAPADTTEGVTSLAMRYFAGEGAQARKVGGRGGRLRCDGVNQPRYTRINQPIRGVEIDTPALQVLEKNEAYLSSVRVPQQRQAGLCLLSLRRLGYGSQPINSSSSSRKQPPNPLYTAATTWLRVCAESETFEEAARYFATGAHASTVCQALAVHVDGASSRARRRPTAEVLTTRWAAAAAEWSDEQRADELCAAREHQPLVAMSLWLRWGLALDVAPCRDLAIVAGTESEHGVPTPLPDASGRDVERGGFTRALAQSCRPDDCLDDLLYEAQVRARGEAGGSGEGEGVRTRQAAGQGQTAAGQRPTGTGRGRQRQPPARFVAGGNNSVVGGGSGRQAGFVPYYRLHQRPAGGWGGARRNRRTGRVY